MERFYWRCGSKTSNRKPLFEFSTLRNLSRRIWPVAISEIEFQTFELNTVLLSGDLKSMVIFLALSQDGEKFTLRTSSLGSRFPLIIFFSFGRACLKCKNNGTTERHPKTLEPKVSPLQSEDSTVWSWEYFCFRECSWIPSASMEPIRSSQMRTR